MIKDDTQDCFAAVHEKDQNRKMSNFSQYAAANNDPSKNILSPVYLSSKFNPTSARAGIAVPSIVTCLFFHVRNTRECGQPIRAM
jgi:hypothetical protein